MKTTAKRVGRPPTFTDGFSRTAVRLRLSKAEWELLERTAEAQGKSFREFLKMRLLRALPELDEEPP